LLALVVGENLEAGIEVLVFETVHPEVEIVERGEPTDEPVQFCHRRFGTDDDVVPLLSCATFLLPPEAVPSISDPLGDIVVSFLCFL